MAILSLTFTNRNEEKADHLQIQTIHDWWGPSSDQTTSKILQDGHKKITTPAEVQLSLPNCHSRKRVTEELWKASSTSLGALPHTCLVTSNSIRRAQARARARLLACCGVSWQGKEATPDMATRVLHTLVQCALRP